jgi:hypothetical protein
MSAAGRFVAWGDFVPPTCRLHYGGILIAVGRWAEAEEELLAAARVFEGGLRAMRAAPLMKLAGLRVRQGRFEEAEHLLEGNESRREARRTLATIALARGDLALAELAAGRLHAAAGDTRARSHLHAALQAFARLDLPYEAARAQLELARSLASQAPAGAAAGARPALDDVRATRSAPGRRCCGRAAPDARWGRRTCLAQALRGR